VSGLLRYSNGRASCTLAANRGYVRYATFFTDWRVPRDSE